MRNLLLPLFAVTLFVTCRAVKIQDCGSKAGSFSKVEVTNCNMDAPPCILKRNSNVTISIEFTPDIECNDVTAVVHGDLLGVQVPFPISNPNACQSPGVDCPIQPQTTYSYTATLPVLKSYPKVKVNVKWELQNAKKDDIVCVIIPAKIE
ncbi:NPC intracellular cholesterol transporter 2 homolog a [Phlebotomus argentipes]|uniref:NPC intracellular cholesterol transporter 2 homolog a n=1 Tax=Phlebotomus argentipes TaxID=94469 RepID=UPI002892DCC3|nr:NPC intracellular cholesterol transporter 2 homolog a [Phlebotomus argentipes]